MTFLTNGQRLPDLEFPAVGGGHLSLPGDLAGSYGVVLVYRGSWCPYCNAQLSAFSRAAGQLDELGIKVVAFSVDEETDAAALVAKHSLSFPVGYGVDAEKVSAVLGSYTGGAGPGFLQSTGFVLAPDGSVALAVYSSGAIGRLVPADVIGLVKYLALAVIDAVAPDYPAMIAPVDHTEPVPRLVRAFLGGRKVLDTVSALYVWEWSNYPQFYVPLDDVDAELLVDEDHVQNLRRGRALVHGLRVGEVVRPGCARVFAGSPVPGVAGRVRFDWDALDAWFEEDEQVFVHPRNPYTRVDALRSSRIVRIELEGTVLAETSAPVLLFETGLPTRYYLDRTCVQMEHLLHTDTETACPYKGVTSDYWAVRIGDTTHVDLAWAYDFPSPGLAAIAGLVAFYNEQVDVFVDGEPLPRPVTHFFRPTRSTGTP